jgi:uncharacterized membrane protein
MKRFWRDEGANMSLLFAAAFSLFGVMGAISVDTAALYYERRMVQSVVDLAAISAAMAPSDAQSIVREVLTTAGLDPTTGLEVVVGNFKPLSGTPAGNRFVRGGLPANAVRVSYQRAGTLHFGRSITDAPTIGASGLAAVTPEVTFSVGSRLASLHGGVANAVLGSLLGTTISLTALDYTGLAATKVDALSFLDALAQKLNVTVGTYDQLLTMNAPVGAIAGALANVTTGAQKSLLTTISLAGNGNKVPLGKLIDAGRYGRLAIGSGADVLGLDLSVLDILSAAASVADGTRQVAVGLGGSIPGVAALSVDLFVGQPAQRGKWLAIGANGSVVRSTQLRLRVDAQVLGGLVLQSALIKLPLWLDIAQSEARLSAATCPDSTHPSGTAELEVIPGVARIAVGKATNAQMRNFGAPLPLTPVNILDALLLKITAAAQVTIAQNQPITVDFSSSDIADARIKTARTTTVVSSLTQSLINGLVLDISVLGFGLSPVSVIDAAVKAVLAPLVSPLDLVVNTVLTALGVRLGEADVRVYGVRCTNPVLVG